MTYIPPTLRLPVPSKNTILIVISDGDRYAVIEVYRSVLTGDEGHCSTCQVVANIFSELDEQMGKAKASDLEQGTTGADRGHIPEAGKDAKP